MNIPIISLEIQGMKNTIKVALTEQAAMMDKHLNDALEKMCTEEAIASIVEQEARRQIELALKEEVQNFFRWSSNGRAAVREAVHEHLSRMYPERGDQQ
jgi:hypothetical protein